MQRAAVADHQTVATAFFADIERAGVGPQRVASRDQNAVVGGGFPLANVDPATTMHLAAVADNQTVATASSADIERAGVGPQRVASRDQNAVVGGGFPVANVDLATTMHLAAVGNDQAVAAAVATYSDKRAVGPCAPVGDQHSVVGGIGPVADFG